MANANCKQQQQQLPAAAHQQVRRHATPTGARKQAARVALLIVLHVNGGLAYEPQWSMRPLNHMAALLEPPLPSIDELLDAKPASVLEIGCGSARALRELTVKMEKRHQTDDVEVCSVGLTLTKYSAFMLNISGIGLPDREKNRARGMAALFDDGLMSSFAVRALERRFSIENSTAPPPIIVDHDYNQGLPFRMQSFDLVVSQASLKWDDRRNVPDASVPQEDSFRFVLDELHRVLRVGGQALIVLGTPEYHPQACARCTMSSAMISGRTGALWHDVHRSANHSAWRRKPTPQESAWLGAQLQKQMLPLEFVVGTVVTSQASGCFTTCRAVCASEVLQDTPTSPRSGGTHHERACVAAFLHHRTGVNITGFGKTLQARVSLFVQKFAPDGDGSCLAAARRLPLLASLTRLVPGELVPEPLSTSRSIANVLRARVEQRHAEELENPALANTIDPMMTAVRLWPREPRPCHAMPSALRHDGGAACDGRAARVVWKDLFVFQPVI